MWGRNRLLWLMVSEGFSFIVVREAWWQEQFCLSQWYYGTSVLHKPRACRIKKRLGPKASLTIETILVAHFNQSGSKSLRYYTLSK